MYLTSRSNCCSFVIDRMVHKELQVDKKICIITGANAGIGREATSQIAGKGYHVVMACRNEKRGQEALKSLLEKDCSLSVELMLVDMSLQNSIRNFARAFKEKYGVLDVLIHNAAMFDISQKKAFKTGEGIEALWAANHLGPVLLTDLLLENLKKSEEGRVITISSQGLVMMPGIRVDLDDPEFDGRKFTVTKAYYQSKRAQVMYTYWLADKLKDTGITVNSIRVTNVKVDLNRYPDLGALMKWMYSIKSKKSISPAQMAEAYTWLATSSELKGVTGKYFNEKNREVKSIKYTYEKDSQQAVMDMSMRYLKEDA